MDHSALEGLKVVTPHEMARIEGLAYARGASEQTFMENAGTAVADYVENFIEEHGLPKSVVLLVGKGNNGGDAYVAGAKLLERGIETMALHIYPLENCSPLCQKMHERFRSKGGLVHQVRSSKGLDFNHAAVILDGLVGTGFHGKAEGILAQAIERANQSGLPIIAIDIPSGLNGMTGAVETVAIQAAETIYLGLPKLGFFQKMGWDHVGTLRYANFGLDEKSIADAKASAYLLNEERIFAHLPKIQRTRHKYQAGYVLSIAGSPGMPGAAILCSYAALRAGAGIVRLFHPAGMEAELSGAPAELIREGWDQKHLTRIQEESKRAKALLLGPGLGRKKRIEKILQQILKKIPLPMVIDADALYFLAKNPLWKLPPGSILTPHHAEMQLLLSKFPCKKEEEAFQSVQAFAKKHQTTIVWKGAPTYVFHPNTLPVIIPYGDPGMATAGSGDVLTGIIAAMLAQGLDARAAAILSVYLHGCSGEAAAEALTSYCMTASDLIDFLPEAFKDVL